MVHGFRAAQTPAQRNSAHKTRTRNASAFAEMLKILNRKVVEQHREGAICREEFADTTSFFTTTKITTVYGSVENREHLSQTFTNR
jgi:hypothetical protein